MDLRAPVWTHFYKALKKHKKFDRHSIIIHSFVRNAVTVEVMTENGKKPCFYRIECANKTDEQIKANVYSQVIMKQEVVIKSFFSYIFKKIKDDIYDMIIYFNIIDAN